LWFQYFNGIGDYLIQNEVPMSIAEFANKLATERKYLAYYSHLFQFLKSLADANKKEFIEKAIEDLRKIKKFLVGTGAVPNIGFEPS
jgi:hypothetical protein